MGSMHNHLTRLPHTINKLFDILDLLVYRLTLLGLAAFAAYALLTHHL
jgi:hypothetical protein